MLSTDRVDAGRRLARRLRHPHRAGRPARHGRRARVDDARDRLRRLSTRQTARRPGVPVTSKRAAGALALVGGVVLVLVGTRASKLARHRVDVAGRSLRHLAGRLHGLSYRLRGRHPDPGVPDEVLADRIRSSLGPVEKRLDLPRVHVMAEDHVAVLHGAVGSRSDADEVERAVAAVSGVSGVESYLHVGLGPGDTRPSEGRGVQQPSDAHQRLLDAATSAGLDPHLARPAVRAILATFADRLPPGERDQVATHLPADVRELFRPPRRTRRGGAAPHRG